MKWKSFLSKAWIVPFLFISYINADEGGAFVNPITDVCWECLFPITVGTPAGAINLTPGYKEASSIDAAICSCAGSPPIIGIPLSFWEPARLVEVTRHAYKLHALGGISIGDENVKNRGSIGVIGEGGTHHSFYHIHWYIYPILSMLEFLTDFTCLESEKFDIGYLSELDPLWNDEQWALALDPEAYLFGNSVAQLACVPDCIAASRGKSLDKLFWCGGCLGSLYPFTGNVSHHVGGIQASSLLVHRMVAKFHRMGLIKGYDKDEFCEAKYMPIIQKSLYKTQLVHPVAETKGPCKQLGQSDLLWGSGKSYPYSGEDFIYLLWRKNHCCLDAVKPTAKALIGDVR